MLPKKAVRIICIILAGLMILSAFGALVGVFAADSSISLAPAPTGDNNADYIVPVALILTALIAVAVCLIIPKLKKKDK